MMHKGYIAFSMDHRLSTMDQQKEPPVTPFGLFIGNLAKPIVMIRNPFFKPVKLRRFDYQPVYYDPKNDKGEDSVSQKRFDFKAAHEELKSDVSPSFDMYHRGSIDFDTDRVRQSRLVKMGLIMGMALIVFVYYVLPRPTFITVIEQAFQLPPLVYEATLFLIVFIMLIFFIREGNKV